MGTWINLEVTSLTPFIGLLFGLALLVSAVGFYRTVYFISIGYAFAITAMAVLVVVGLRQNLSWATLLQNAGLVLWGVRLGTYLLQREAGKLYRKSVEPVYERTNKIAAPAKVGIWLSVSLLYVAMFSPSLFSLSAGSGSPSMLGLGAQLLGLVTMFGGLILEALADKQKADFKARFPTRFCNVGLYRWVRCPNYLGEILFWVGNWIMGIPFYTTLLQWVISIVGAVCLTLIMLGSTKRLERSQVERYGDLPEYVEYASRVPVLIPFLPIYTLKNVRVYLE